MWLIIALIVVGVVLLVAEFILLPGLTVAGICAVGSYAAAVYIAFTRYGTSGGIMALGAIAIVSIAATLISLRSKTWQRFSLKHNIDSTSQPLPENEIKTGDHGITITRLAPIGKIAIGENTYEAKSLGDIYVDPRQEVEVVGFENFTVIVKLVKDN